MEIISTRLWWAGHVTRMREYMGVFKNVIGKSTEKGRLGGRRLRGEGTISLV